MKKNLRSNYKQRKTFKPQKRPFFTKEEMFLSRMASILLMPKNRVKRIFSQRDITTIRLNPLNGSVSETKDLLEKRGCNLEKISWAENVFFVKNRDKSEMAEYEEYKRGLFYIQNLSSILSSIVLDPQEGERILDMCAAPGSKTTHICALVNNNAEIIANDSDQTRVRTIQNLLHQFGGKARVMNNEGQVFGQKFPDHFDRILVDAPCSGEGLIYLNGKKPLRFWSIKKVKVSSIVQKELIVSAFKSLKTGGTLIYSTCTLEPEENEGVITYLLENFKNARVEKIEIAGLQGTTRGITKWSGNRYHQEVAKTIRIIPSPKMMGFYVAQITKV